MNDKNNIPGTNPGDDRSLPDGDLNSLVDSNGENYDDGYNYDEKDDVQSLTKLPTFEEHMASMEKDASIDEKYYQQAEAERNRWIEASRSSLEYTKNLEPDEFKYVANIDEVTREKATPIYKTFDKENTELMAKWNKSKADQIQSARERLEKDRNANLDEIAKAFKNKETIDQIAVKLESGENFTEEEKKFLGNGPDSLDDYFFDHSKFETPQDHYERTHGFIEIPQYKHLLNPSSNAPEYWKYWGTIARAQLREIEKQDRLLLHENKDVQNVLENMDENRTSNPFAGETNVDSATGETRTFTIEDNYPRLDNESEKDYSNRLKRIQLKTRLAEKRQGEN